MTGSVTLNQITDKELVIVFEHKAAHGNLFSFNPQTMSPGTIPAPGPGAATPCYNNLIFGWQQPAGLKAVIELLQKIEHHRAGLVSGAQRA